MADINNEVMAVVQDLKEKIEKFNEAEAGASNLALEKIQEVTRKATSVLNDASNKILEVANEVTDPEEIKNGLDIIKNKSRVLFENTLAKIDEIKKEFPIKNVIEDKKDEIDQYFSSAKKETIKKYINEDQSDLDKVVINVLVDWLKPEDR